MSAPSIRQILAAIKESGPSESIPLLSGNPSVSIASARRTRESLLKNGLVKFEKGRYSLTAAGEDFIK